MSGVVPKCPLDGTFGRKTWRRRPASSWLEDRVFSDGLEALVESEVLVNLPPLAPVPHVGEVEAAVAYVFKAGKR
jgi:hypothetical protein